MIQKIQELRNATGLGMMACKSAIEETSGDVEKAIEILRKKGAIKAANRSEREANEGIITSYIHSNNKIGVLLKVACETDFVARNDDFIEFAKDVSMHIAAMSPRYVSPDEVSPDDIEKEKEIYAEQLKNEGKPENMIPTIVEKKLKKFAEEHSLLKQAFVKDPTKKIEEILVEINNKVGENVQIITFTRYEI